MVNRKFKSVSFEFQGWVLNLNPHEKGQRQMSGQTVKLFFDEIAPILDHTFPNFRWHFV